jgi:CMP-N-acetylneuraminic acid synthetase
VHWRAPETATSTASTESAILDFVGAHPDYDILCLIQATSPFIAPDDFIQGLELLQSTGSDSLVTAVRAHRFMWSVDPKTMAATAKNYEPLKRPRRQDWDGELIENGAFYLTRKAVLQKHGCRLGGKMVRLETHTLALALTLTQTPTPTPTRCCKRWPSTPSPSSTRSLTGRSWQA